MKMKPACRMRGYTLLESIVVLSLLAVALGVGATSMRGAFLREEIDGQARAVIHNIGAAQQQAMAMRTTVTVTFQNNIYLVSGGGSTLINGTMPSHISFGGSPTILTFNRRGVPGGTLAVTMASSTAGRTYAIMVDSGTGRASYNAY
jgi:prepilin-type N-terminal cleavage/methylation domain-containing protein